MTTAVASTLVDETYDAPEQCTLLELVSVMNEVTENESEVVATVVHMIRTGAVELTGNFRGAGTACFADVALAN